MLTRPLKGDTFISDDRGTDFLSPEIKAQSRFRELNRSPVINRNVPFLLEGEMETKKWSKKDYHTRNPWAKYINYISTRCTTQSHPYFKKGIKNYLKVSDLKYLWFRDKAFLMKRPSIHRVDVKKHYSRDNCEFVELIENLKEGGRYGWITPEFYLSWRICKVCKQNKPISEFPRDINRGKLYYRHTCNFCWLPMEAKRMRENRQRLTPTP